MATDRTEFTVTLQYCNELSMTIELDTTLAQAEVLFLSFSQLVADVDRRRAEELDTSANNIRRRGALNAREKNAEEAGKFTADNMLILSENLRELLIAGR
jgi:hypothetical protein